MNIGLLFKEYGFFSNPIFWVMILTPLKLKKLKKLHPRAARYMFLGCFIYLVCALMPTTIIPYLYAHISTLTASDADLEKTYFTLLYKSIALFNSLGLALIVLSGFVGRAALRENTSNAVDH